MWYVEFLRARKALSIYGILLLLVLIIAVLVRVFGRVYLNGHTHFAPPQLESYALLAAFVTAIFSTTLATSLAYQVAGHLEFAWTKPAGRERLIRDIVFVDIAAIAVAYIGTLTSCVGFVALLSGKSAVVITSLGIVNCAIELTFVCAFYLLVQGATAPLGRRAGVVAGMSWPVLLGLASGPSAGLPEPLSRALAAIDYLNPLALLTVSSHRGAMTNVLHLPVWGAASLVDAGAIMALSFGIAVLRWRRLET